MTMHEPRSILLARMIFSEERSASYPDAPTLREQGQDVVLEAWFGFMAPAATPDPIVDRRKSITLSPTPM